MRLLTPPLVLAATIGLALAIVSCADSDNADSDNGQRLPRDFTALVTNTDASVEEMLAELGPHLPDFNCYNTSKDFIEWKRSFQCIIGEYPSLVGIRCEFNFFSTPPYSPTLICVDIGPFEFEDVRGVCDANEAPQPLDRNTTRSCRSEQTHVLCFVTSPNHHIQIVCRS